MAACAAPTSPLREILERRLSDMLRDFEQLIEAELAAEVERRTAGIIAEARARACGTLADQLNQAARRIRQVANREQLVVALIDTAGPFASGVALVSVTGSRGRGERIRGVSAERAEAFQHWEVALESAPALAEAVKTSDPITALAEGSQVSPGLASIVETADARVSFYPVNAGGQVAAILCAWGIAQSSTLELLSQMAGAMWAALPTAANLVSIETPKPARGSSWDSLDAEERRVHLRAQRVARVEMARIRLQESDAVQAGRTRRDLYAALREPIDAARDSFRKTFFDSCPSMVDYLHLELIRTLANENPELLGKDYPGPLV
jgi:hypothetical protein